MMRTMGLVTTVTRGVGEEDQTTADGKVGEPTTRARARRGARRAANSRKFIVIGQRFVGNSLWVEKDSQSHKKKLITREKNSWLPESEKTMKNDLR